MDCKYWFMRLVHAFISCSVVSLCLIDYTFLAFSAITSFDSHYSFTKLAFYKYQSTITAYWRNYMGRVKGILIKKDPF